MVQSTNLHHSNTIDSCDRWNRCAELHFPLHSHNNALIAYRNSEVAYDKWNKHLILPDFWLPWLLNMLILDAEFFDSSRNTNSCVHRIQTDSATYFCLKWHSHSKCLRTLRNSSETGHKLKWFFTRRYRMENEVKNIRNDRVILDFLMTNLKI